ncbi:MAG TPA: CDP-diacylglycerol--serine O-phosphatidyltransferase [Bacteroidales bacterium]|jgi:CDP-diacylglycerol--serine O-phosphatidyltransferase|nr:CDP-diacylglycerol--serine O-phosphatidyltransferase [Bacteroidales bacterium]
MRLFNPVKHIPNTLSLINLLFGCLSIVSSFEGNLLLAGYFILFAAVFDYLDGFAARLLKAYSPLGKELDSLSDLVSFGVAPSVIVFHLLKDALALAPEQGFTNGNVILAIPFLIAAFSALRLAIFNIDTRQTTSFIGLPTPANAIFIVGVVLGLNSPYKVWFEVLTTSPVAIIAMVLVLSALLVAPIPMFSLKVKKNDMGIGLWKQILLLVVSVIAILLMGLASVALIILVYVLLSIVNNVFVRFKKR